MNRLPLHYHSERFQNILQFFRGNWPFLLGPAAVSFAFVAGQPKIDYWKIYGVIFLLSLLATVPASMLFYFRKTALKFLPDNFQLMGWAALSGAYFFLLIVGLSKLFGNDHTGTALALANITLGVGLCLHFSDYFKATISKSAWWKKLNFDQSVILTLALLSVVFACMAVSSMENPEFDKPGKLLVGFVFEPAKLWKYFPTLLSIALQVFTMYMVGYLLYFINQHILIRQLLSKKGLVHYLLGTGTVLALFTPFGLQLINSLPVNDLFGRFTKESPFEMENIGVAFMLLLFTTPIILAVQWFRQNQHISQLEKEKVANELHLLKEQINPHFFFNTLNNLYSLSLANSPQTPEVILQLSELMRYVIYKGKEERVKLSEEVQYLQDYVKLHQIRSYKNLALKFRQEIADPDLKVPPLLFIILVENAFKHGIEPSEGDGFLHITIRSTSEQLRFECRNSMDEPSSESGGMGLTNLRKRLELLFPNRFELKTKASENDYLAILEIRIYPGI